MIAKTKNYLIELFKPIYEDNLLIIIGLLIIIVVLTNYLTNGGWDF